jgi:hypothetical protein
MLAKKSESQAWLFLAQFYTDTTRFGRDGVTSGPSLSVEVVIAVGVIVLGMFVVKFLHPMVSLYVSLQRAKAIGLPMKVVPFPPGPFSFFAFQIVRRLSTLSPGTTLYRSLNMGRPDGYGLHKEMGDAFVTVSLAGLTLIVADPEVVTQVNSKKMDFPKPPYTGGK